MPEEPLLAQFAAGLDGENDLVSVFMALDEHDIAGAPDDWLGVIALHPSATDEFTALANRHAASVRLPATFTWDMDGAWHRHDFEGGDRPLHLAILAYESWLSSHDWRLVGFDLGQESYQCFAVPRAELGAVQLSLEAVEIAWYIPFEQVEGTGRVPSSRTPLRFFDTVPASAVTESGHEPETGQLNEDQARTSPDLGGGIRDRGSLAPVDGIGSSTDGTAQATTVWPRPDVANPPDEADRLEASLSRQARP